MIKPTGAACNLACTYCYYLEKADLYPKSKFRMDYATLERVTAAYLQAHPAGEVVFGWQGGEPLLMGIEFFQRALEFQQVYSRPDQLVQNALQTNGTLITDDWARFLAEHKFLVGISIDGPAEFHDRHRLDRAGQATHARVLRGLARLQAHHAECNALTTVNAANVGQPLKVYRYLTGLGFKHLQFIPVVERELGENSKVTPWSVTSAAFGSFLCETFDYWSLNDVGRVFVQLFEAAVNVWLGGLPALCTLSPVCGRAMVVEHTGDLYACDHFVDPEYRRGQVTPEGLAALVEGREQRAFGMAKAQLSVDCRRCPVLRFCGGDCPKHRLNKGNDGVAVSHLCAAYRRFFVHSTEVCSAMANEVRAGRPAASVMHLLRLMKGLD